MLDFRRDDGFLARFDFSLVIGPDPGNWRPVTPTAVDPDAWVGDEKPFLIESQAQFRSDEPNALTSGAYAKDFDEVEELGAIDSTSRTADETAAAVFWQVPPIALWNGVARDLAGRYGLEAADQARLYAMINLAAADGGSAAGTTSGTGTSGGHVPRSGRPTPTATRPPSPSHVGVALRARDADEPAARDAALPRPSLGARGASAARRSTRSRTSSGRTSSSFDVVGGRSLDGALIPARHFDRFSRALKEIIDARVWGGIHFRTADVQGAVIGKKVAHWMDKHYFQPVR